MNIIGWLKKLGILQSGGSSWQGKAENRPADFMESENFTVAPPAEPSPETPEATSDSDES